mmetsp:Transcript_2049/g.6505  ORF Transcript_2049/g.6505 Transcript_2049/m.6505 type:complete len:384 (+) Transcript_2049:78-1229(+)
MSTNILTISLPLRSLPTQPLSSYSHIHVESSATACSLPHLIQALAALWSCTKNSELHRTNLTKIPSLAFSLTLSPKTSARASRPWQEIAGEVPEVPPSLSVPHLPPLSLDDRLLNILATATKPAPICTGGTFDRLHAGHALLLQLAVALAQAQQTVAPTSNSASQWHHSPSFPYPTTPPCRIPLYVGLTTDALLTQKANSHLLRSYRVRAAQLALFLQQVALVPPPPSLLKSASTSLSLSSSLCISPTIFIVPLFDAGGPPCAIEAMRVIVGTEESGVKKGVRWINEQREQRRREEEQQQATAADSSPDASLDAGGPAQAGQKRSVDSVESAHPARWPPLSLISVPLLTPTYWEDRNKSESEREKGKISSSALRKAEESAGRL